MKLSFDPAAPDFLEALRRIPGYPPDEEVPIRAMVFESNALLRLPEMLACAGAHPTKPLCIVMDELPIRRNGVELKPLIINQLQQEGWRPQAVVLKPERGSVLHTDLYQIERVKAQLAPNAAVLAVGSGTITDIAKHACYLYELEHSAHIPFVVLPTANSVSAYTSNTASVEIRGVKKTLPSRYLDVLVCDLETLSSAPTSATVAGVGDLLVAFGSFADWFLAHRVGLDPHYSDLPRILIGPLDELFLQHGAEIREATPYGTKLLAKLLALEGLAQSLAHTSAPFSGFEHSISHLLDLILTQYKQPPILHGTQVVLLTLLTTLAYEEFLRTFDPARVDLEACYPSADEMQARLHRALATLDPSGSIAAECWSEYRKKLKAWHAQRAAFEKFLSEWDAVQTQLQTLVRPPSLLVAILRRMHAPTHFEQLDPPLHEELIKFAFVNASWIRNRFTLGDLLLFLNWDLEELWSRLWRASRAL